MTKLTKYLIILGILILILGQGGLLFAVFGFIISLFKIPAFIGLLIIIVGLLLHYNKKDIK
ncbi:MAG: hypothetical protein ACJ0NN_00875 [Thermodesulfobacteriota bacterium]|tara:strand:+ start:1146 stop:1328 length:183 start_codon:yes stop_codon:yes gene_type:complete